MMVGGRMSASFRRVQQINDVVEVTRSRELGSRVTAITAWAAWRGSTAGAGVGVGVDV